MPSVSVIMATYNQADYVEEAVQSLLAQTLERPRFEILAVDDGSTDRTADILSKHEKDIVFIRKEHSGLADTCNRGIAMARGEYIVRVDSDDAAEPELLSLGKEALDRDPAAVCVFSDRWEMGPQGARRAGADPRNIYAQVACGVMMRKGAVLEAGGFRPLFWEEYDLFLRLKQKGKFLYVPRPLYRYRIHPGGMTQDPQARRRGWEELIARWDLKALRAAGSHPELEQVAKEKGARS